MPYCKDYISCLVTLQTASAVVTYCIIKSEQSN